MLYESLTTSGTFNWLQFIGEVEISVYLLFVLFVDAIKRFFSFSLAFAHSLSLFCGLCFTFVPFLSLFLSLSSFLYILFWFCPFLRWRLDELYDCMWSALDSLCVRINLLTKIFFFTLEIAAERGILTAVDQIKFTPKSERDYGALACYGRNSIGKQTEPCLFQVVPAGKFILWSQNLINKKIKT